MHVVLLHAVGVGRIGANGVDSQVSLDVVDHKRRIIDVPRPRCGCRFEVACSAWCRPSSSTVLRGLRTTRRTCRSSFSGVCNVKAFREIVDTVAYFSWKAKRWVHRIQCHVSCTARANAERGDFGHVDPDSGEWNFLVPLYKLLDPP